MKKTIFATIAFAIAAVPMTFAAQTTPANPPASGAKAAPATVKKHKKHVVKKTSAKKPVTSAPAAGK